MSTVSAIVSTYNSARFLPGRIDDLLAQTLHTQGRLEIIVVNAGSKQYEHDIVMDYMGRGVKLTYIRSLREPLYVSWNRGIRISAADYIVPANADDRLRPDALEVLADALDAAPDAAPDVGLVYADAYVTKTPNARWDGDYALSYEPPYTTGRLNWPDYDPALLRRFYFLGQSPMWRRSLHERCGLMDESYQLAGDYEWALRLAAYGVAMRRVDDVLGLFYFDGMGVNGAELSGSESRRALLRWGGQIHG